MNDPPSPDDEAARESAASVLVVEDDEALGAQIVATLEGAGFVPTWLRNGTAAMRADPEAHRLVVLDLMLPGAHGFDVLKAIRERSDVPVLVLTARDETRDKVRGLELGADDYVTKPFWPEELLARVHARLRRPALRRSDGVTFGDVAVALDARRVIVSGREVELTKVEFELLATLIRRPGKAFSRAELVDRVLDPDRQGTERTLDVHVSRLRKKLGEAGGHVATVWGIGYRFEDEPATPGRNGAG